MNELALFAGAGGGILGGHLLGWKTVAACEIEDYPRETLLRRQLDGILPRFPVWDDINTFDGTPFRGRIDIVSGGFPCQDISAAGKGTGITGERSGLWKEMHRIIGEVRPRFAFLENSPMLTSRGLGTVLGDLAEIGYDAEWIVLGADDVGAPHRRKRIWILAYTDSRGFKWGNRAQQKSRGNEPKNIGIPENVANTGRKLWKERKSTKSESWTIRANADLYNQSSSQRRREAPWETEPRVGRMVNGVANSVDRLKAIGNGQVPSVAAIAFIALYKRIYE